MIPLALAWAGAKKFLSAVPRQVWYPLAIIAAIWFYGHLRYNAGQAEAKSECVEASRKAQEAANKAAIKQQEAAPIIAQEAIEAVKPKVIERVRIIRENIPVNVACPDYNDSVQSQVREAASAAD